MTFTAFLESLGLVPGPIVPDGRWKRTSTQDHPKKKNGAYKLAIDARVGWAQNWATMQEPAVWTANGIEVPAFDPQRLSDARAEALARARAQQEASRAACDFYLQCKRLLNSHPYLDSHGLDMRGCLGLKVDRNGWLVVPMQRGPKLVSVQRISPDGHKLFWPGAPTKGATYMVNRPTASLTVICEGLATALAIYAAVQTSRIIVAFTAGNLSRVTVPVGLAVFAADNDRATEGRTGTNPGVDGARTAAESCGAGVAIPDCRDDETDWCDVRNRMLRERMEKRLPHEQHGSIKKAVDAQVVREITRAAKFVSHVHVCGVKDNNRLTDKAAVNGKYEMKVDNPGRVRG